MSCSPFCHRFAQLTVLMFHPATRSLQNRSVKSPWNVNVVQPFLPSVRSDDRVDVSSSHTFATEQVREVTLECECRAVPFCHRFAQLTVLMFHPATRSLQNRSVKSPWNVNVVQSFLPSVRSADRFDVSSSHTFATEQVREVTLECECRVVLSSMYGCSANP